MYRVKYAGRMNAHFAFKFWSNITTIPEMVQLLSGQNIIYLVETQRIHLQLLLQLGPSSYIHYFKFTTASTKWEIRYASVWHTFSGLQMNKSQNIYDFSVKSFIRMITRNYITYKWVILWFSYGKLIILISVWIRWSLTDQFPTKGLRPEKSVCPCYFEDSTCKLLRASAKIANRRIRIKDFRLNFLTG